MDSPFVGPTYPLRSKPASVQRTVNMMPIPIEVQNERIGWVLKDVPGLVLAHPKLPPIYYTSWPYALIVDEAIGSSLSVPSDGLLWYPPLETLTVSLSAPLTGTLVAVLHPYNNALPDQLTSGLSGPLTGTLVKVLHVYSDALPDELASLQSAPSSGTLVVVLITYSNWPADKLDSGLSTPMTGTLT